MANIKEFNRKIKSLKNSEKMTKTMKMVSASKLRKAHHAQSSAKQYADKLTGLISRISLSLENTSHPLLTSPQKNENVLILVFSSDRGLCGGFNNSLIKQVLSWIRENKPKYKTIDSSFCGKRGFMSLKRFVNLKKNYENMTSSPKFSDAITIGEELASDFTKGVYDEIFIAYNQFFSPLSQKAVFQKILPIDPKNLLTNEGLKSSDYLYDPSAAELLNTLIPHYLYFKIFFSLLENAAGEHGARMTAMDNATKNASELMGRYTLLRNRARQAAITTELTEIVSGAEALK